jgi:hypothetical protein
MGLLAPYHPITMVRDGCFTPSYKGGHYIDLSSTRDDIHLFHLVDRMVFLCQKH